MNTTIQKIQSQGGQNKLPNNEIEQLGQIITGFLEFDRQQRLSLDKALDLVGIPNSPEK